MVRSLADRTFQPSAGPSGDEVALQVEGDGADGTEVADLAQLGERFGIALQFGERAHGFPGRVEP